MNEIPTPANSLSMQLDHIFSKAIYYPCINNWKSDTERIYWLNKTLSNCLRSKWRWLTIWREATKCLTYTNKISNQLPKGEVNISTCIKGRKRKAHSTTKIRLLDNQREVAWHHLNIMQYHILCIYFLFFRNGQKRKTSTKGKKKKKKEKTKI